MPQLDTGTYASQLFWLFISFGGLLWVSFTITLPRMARILKDRWEKTEGLFLTAQNLRDQVLKIQQQLDFETNENRKKAHDIIVKTAHDLSISAAAERAEISQKMTERFKALEWRILEKKAETMGEIQTLSGTIAADIVEKLIQGQFNQGPIAPFSDSKMA